MTRRRNTSALAALAVPSVHRPSPAAAVSTPSATPDGAVPPAPSTPAKKQRRAGAVRAVESGPVLRLTIPGQPVGKGRPRFSRRSGTTYTPAETERAEATVRSLARLAGFTPLSGRLALRVVFFCDTLRGDVDNFIKLVTDALNGVAYGDDRQIDAIDARRDFDWSQPRTELEIEQIADEAPARPKQRKTGGGR